jgi:hypothetical protein
MERINEINNIQSGIKENIEDPKQLELLYRKNKVLFKQAFNSLYNELNNNAIAQAWHERLNYQEEEINWGISSELKMVALIAFLTGLLAKSPQIFDIEPDYFFSRNIGLIAFPMLMFFFAWKQGLAWKSMLLPIIAVVVSGVYINLLPKNEKSDTLVLACIHLPILLWTMLGFAFAGGDMKNVGKRIGFLRYNGDLVVMSSIMVLSGILFSGLTFGLFEIIGLDITSFYVDYVVIWGLSAIPVLATFMVRNNPQLVDKISPTIAKIFTPLVAITLLVFLSAMAFTRKSIYHDRDFLMIFNALLIFVMAIVLFSITEATKKENNRVSLLFLFALSILTVITNGIALSAIGLRIFEYGITPNRLAVLVSNLLIFMNLIWITHQLLQNIKKKKDAENIEQAIAFFLPIYGLWTAIVVFIIPVLFGFK